MDSFMPINIGLNPPVDSFESKAQRATNSSIFFLVIEHYNNVFKPTTLAGWIQGQEKIFNSPYRSRAPRNWNPEWPELEGELFRRFHQRREEIKLVGRGWFERESKKIWPEQYPDLPAIFTVSNSWFQRFRQRYGISFRRLTKQVTSASRSMAMIKITRLIIILLYFRPKNFPQSMIDT